MVESNARVARSSRFFWLLVGGIALLSLFVITVVTLALRQSRLQYHEQAATISQNLSQVLEQNIAGTFRRIDMALLEAADEYSHQIASGQIDARELNEHLELQYSHLPEVVGLRIASAQGLIEYGTGLAAGAKTSIADRDHFLFPRNNPSMGLFISKPIVGRISGTWIVILARRLNHPDGSFAGVVFAPVELKQFINTFSTINVGPHGVISLRDGDLGIIVRYPEPDGVGSSIGLRNISPQLQELIRAGKASGSYQARSAVDNIERSFSFRKIPDQSLYIFVGLALDDYLVEWRRMAVSAALLVALFLLVTAITTWLIYREWKSRMLAEEALLKSEAQLKNAQKLAQLGSWKLDLSNNVLTWSDEIFHIFEIDPAHFGASYEAFLNAIHPEDREQVNTAYTESVKNHTVYGIEHRLLFPDGRVKHVAERGETFYDAQGRPVRSVGTVQDITERKQVEETLREQKEFLNAILESEPECVKVISADGQLLQMNLAGLTMLEVDTLEEVQEFGLKSFVLPEYRDAFLKLSGRVFRGETGVLEFAIRGKRGTQRWLETHATPLRDAKGKVVALVGVTRDITERKRAEDALRTLSTTVEQSPASVVITDLDANIEYVNPRFTEVTGYKDEEVIGHNPRILGSGLTPPETYRELWKSITTGKAWHGELINKRKNGEVFYEEAHIAPVQNSGGDVTHYVAVKTDITERKKAEELIRQNEANLRFMLETSPIAIRIASQSGRKVLFANQRYAELINSAQDEVIGVDPKDYYAKSQEYEDILERLSKGERITSKLVELRIPGGEAKWALASYLMMEFENEQCVLGWFYDITERKRAEEQLQHLAHYDALTDLPNRSLFNDRFRQALAIAKRKNELVALMFLDLDQFKPINDTYGHDVGDLVLREVAKRMQDCLRESDTISRIGGDEFILLLADIKKEQDAVAVGEKLRQALALPFELAGHRLHISSSIGVAIYPAHGRDEIQLLKNADVAMYHAKKNGRNNVKLFHTEMLGGGG